MSVAIVYTTLPDRESALRLGREMVERGVVACANIVPGMVSVFAWEGRIQEAEEVILLLKTSSVRLGEVLVAVEQAHPYEVPCVLGAEVSVFSEKFAAWVAGCVGAGLAGSAEAVDFVE